MALFISKRRELRIIVKPSDRTFDEARRPVIIRGEKVEFSNHRFQTADEGLVSWLKQHPLYGREFTSADTGPTPAPRNEGPEMIHGMNTTLGEPKKPDETPKSTYEIARGPYETPITWEEIEVKMDQKMDSFLEKFSHIMQSQAVAKEVPAQKRVFHCPICNAEFKSGIEVGKHKKLVHPN